MKICILQPAQRCAIIVLSFRIHHFDLYPYMLIRSLVLILPFFCLASCRGDRGEVLFEEEKIVEVKSYDLRESSLRVEGGTNSTSFTYDNNAQRVDILTPTKANGSRQLFVTIHSGGFLSGSRKNPIISKYCHDLAGSGYYVANVDYRDAIEEMNFSREKVIFTAVNDVDKAINKAISVLEPQGVIDRDSVILLGYSAGAIIALSMAYTDRDELEEYFKDAVTTEFDGYLRSQYRVSGVVALAGAMMDSDCFDSNELSSRPLLMMHGEEDLIVSPNNAKPFERFISNDYVMPLDLITGEVVVAGEVNEHSMWVSIAQNSSLTIHKEWKAMARDLLVKRMAGSRELVNKCNDNAKLILYQGEGSDHTFMLNDGKYLNANYDDSFRRILEFASR